MTEDHELVQRLREGDESAFAELIDTYGATMLRVIRRNLLVWWKKRRRAIANESCASRTDARPLAAERATG
jgi:hypothetical protein